MSRRTGDMNVEEDDTTAAATVATTDPVGCNLPTTTTTTATTTTVGDSDGYRGKVVELKPEEIKARFDMVFNETTGEPVDSVSRTAGFTDPSGAAATSFWSTFWGDSAESHLAVSTGGALTDGDLFNEVLRTFEWHDYDFNNTPTTFAPITPKKDDDKDKKDDDSSQASGSGSTRKSRTE